ncbi:MAG: sulfotransferase [Gammaproteobacteria bacterium]
MIRNALLGLNRGIHPIDKYFAKTAVPGIPQPLFIVGPPRSGTTLLYQLVAQHFNVAYMTAPLAYAHGASNLITRLLKPILGRPKPIFTSNYGSVKGLFSPSEHAHFWYQWFPENATMGHYHSPYQLDTDSYTDLRNCLDSLAAITNRPWVFKNLYIGISAGVIARILPEARFLFVRRDPMMVFQSLLRGRMQHDGQQWWSVKPPHYREWLNLPLWQQVTRQVFYSEAIPLRDLEHFAQNRVLEINYTDLCEDPHSSLHRIQTWLKPLGYTAYPRNSKIPQAFHASSELRIDQPQLRLVREEFMALNEKFYINQD